MSGRPKPELVHKNNYNGKVRRTKRRERDRSGREQHDSSLELWPSRGCMGGAITCVPQGPSPSNTEPHRRKARPVPLTACPGLILSCPGPTEKRALQRGGFFGGVGVGGGGSVANARLEQVPAFLTRWGLGLFGRDRYFNFKVKPKIRRPAAEARGS